MDRASIGWFSLILSFYALRNATQADVTIISKTAPLFITIFSAIFLKESIPKAQFPALALVLTALVQFQLSSTVSRIRVRGHFIDFLHAAAVFQGKGRRNDRHSLFFRFQYTGFHAL